MCARQQYTGSYRYCSIFSSHTGMLFCNLPSVPNRIREDKTLPSASYTLLDVVWVGKKKKKKNQNQRTAVKEKMPGVEGGKEGDCQEGYSFQRAEHESAEWFFLIIYLFLILQSTVMPWRPQQMKPLYSEPVCVLSIGQQDLITSWQRNSL